METWAEAATFSPSAAGFYRAGCGSGVGGSRNPLRLCERVPPTRGSVGFARPSLCSGMNLTGGQSYQQPSLLQVVRRVNLPARGSVRRPAGYASRKPGVISGGLCQPVTYKPKVQSGRGLCQPQARVISRTSRHRPSGSGSAGHTATGLLVQGQPGILYRHRPSGSGSAGHTATSQGFGRGGLCQSPIISPAAGT